MNIETQLSEKVQRVLEKGGEIIFNMIMSENITEVTKDKTPQYINPKKDK